MPMPAPVATRRAGVTCRWRRTGLAVTLMARDPGPAVTRPSPWRGLGAASKGLPRHYWPDLADNGVNFGRRADHRTPAATAAPSCAPPAPCAKDGA